MSSQADAARLHYIIPITDDHGNTLAGNTTEPEPGSVVLTQGEFGTAWQRWFTDGLWHATGRGGTKTWDGLLIQRNLVLVYEATIRPDRALR